MDRSRSTRLHMQTNGALRSATRRTTINSSSSGGGGGLLTLRNVAASSMPIKGVPWSEVPTETVLTKASPVTPGFASRKQLTSSMRQRRRSNEDNSVINGLTSAGVDCEIPSGDLAALRSSTCTTCCKPE